MTDEAPQIVDKAALFGGGRQLPTHDYEIPGMGVIRFREVSRSEALNFAEVAEKKGVVEWERQVLSTVCVEPSLTYDDAKAWQAVSNAAEIGELMEFINEKSGIKVDAKEEATERFPD